MGHPSSQNLGLADRPLCRKLADRNGSRSDRPLLEFIAGKQSLNSASWKRPVVTRCFVPIAALDSMIPSSVRYLGTALAINISSGDAYQAFGYATQ